MIQLKTGNILTANVDVIVNTVNCVGVMGKGIALQFKMKYPDNYKFYKKICDQGSMRIGKILIFELSTADTPKYIFNFPTKRHWKTKSKIDDIQKGLNALIEEIKKLKIHSVAIPALGSGLGGLNWQQVKSIITDSFSKLPQIDVWLYEPNYSPSVNNISVNTNKPKMTLTKALLIKLLQIYQTLGYPFSLLEIQKLLYFMDNILNNELKFKFEKKQYGPYSNKINHLLQDMENHFIRGYGDRNQKAEIRLLETTINKANDFLAPHKHYFEKLNQIERLIDGFETPFGIELLATVHWVATKECHQFLSNKAIISHIKNWNLRKKNLFQPYQVEIAITRLMSEQWLPSCFLDD